MIATPEKISYSIEDLKKAITDRSLADLEKIIKDNPSLLNQTFADGEDPISLATKTLLQTIQKDGQDNPTQILRKILQEKFKGFPQQAEIDLETLFLNKVLLEQLYAEKNTDVDFEIFKKAILETLNKSSSNNSFNNIYKQIFESIKEAKEDNQKKPIKDADNNSMFIYSSGLKNHQSYFIFHVDAQNKLTSISYCDGSSTENSKIKGSSTHIQGVTTFALENSVKYSSEFAQKFINDNTKGKSIEDFHKKLEDKTIQISGAKIVYKNTKYSIPTTAQKGENYTSKNTSILARFVAQKTNPQMTFELDEKTKKPKGDGHNEYKKFKENLIKEASKSTLELQEKTSKKSDNFSEYLKKEIKKTLDEAEKNNKRKLSSGQSSPSKLSISSSQFSSQRLPNPRKIFHQELSEILSKKIQKEPEKTPPIEELTITQELQKKFPDYFLPKIQSSIFYASRSKSPSISLRENLTVEEKAKFIKEYHDLIENKYKEIKSRKTKNDVKDEGLVAEGIKEQNLFKELKKLDEKVKELLAKDSIKLNEELYKLSPDHYPQATIIGRNALQSRKKSSKALTGVEYIKFSVLSDLIEVGKKIVEQKEPKNEDCNKTIEARFSVTNIHRYLQFSSKDLEIFSDSYKRFQDFLESPNKNPLSLIEEICDVIQKKVNDDEKLQPQQNTELKKTRDTKENFNSYGNFLNLIKKEQKRELNLKMELKRNIREQKKITNKFAFHLLSNPNNQEPKKILENINSLKIKNINEKDLMDFLKLSNCESITEKISTLETLETLKQPEPQKEDNNTTKMLKAVGDYLTKMKEEETNLIKTFQNEFKTKSNNYEIINSLLIKIKENDLELKIFCKALDKDNELKFELGDLKLFLNNLSDDKEKELLTLENTLKIESKIKSGNLKILQDFIRENKEELLKQQPLTTKTSLFFGFVPHDYSNFIPKEIKGLVKTPVRFCVRLFEEMQQKPDTNIFQAFHEVLLNINNKKTK